MLALGAKIPAAVNHKRYRKKTVHSNQQTLYIQSNVMYNEFHFAALPPMNAG